MRSPRALPDRCLTTQTGEVIFARTLGKSKVFCSILLGQAVDRGEGLAVEDSGREVPPILKKGRGQTSIVYSCHFERM